MPPRPAHRIRHLPLHTLRPHEAVKETKARAYARFTARSRRMVAKPLLIDERSRVILDGHHRWWVLRQMGFTSVPCCCIDYLGDDSVQVLPRRSDIPVSKADVIHMGLSGKTYPHKTTKHVYDIPEMDREVTLAAAPKNRESPRFSGRKPAAPTSAASAKSSW